MNSRQLVRSPPSRTVSATRSDRWRFPNRHRRAEAGFPNPGGLCRSSRIRKSGIAAGRDSEIPTHQLETRRPRSSADCAKKGKSRFLVNWRLGLFGVTERPHPGPLPQEREWARWGLGVCLFGDTERPHPGPLPQEREWARWGLGVCLFGDTKRPHPDPLPQEREWARLGLGVCLFGDTKRPHPDPLPQEREWVGLGVCLFGDTKRPHPDPLPQERE